MKTQSTDVIQLTLTLKMTTAQVVETSVTVNNNSPIQDYVYPDEQTQPFVLPLITSNFRFIVSLHRLVDISKINLPTSITAVAKSH